MAIGDPGIGKLHRGVQLGCSARDGGVEVEGRLPGECVGHWARKL
jgi:hypothetical protein